MRWGATLIQNHLQRSTCVYVKVEEHELEDTSGLPCNKCLKPLLWRAGAFAQPMMLLIQTLRTNRATPSAKEEIHSAGRRTQSGRVVPLGKAPTQPSTLCNTTTTLSIGLLNMPSSITYGITSGSTKRLRTLCNDKYLCARGVGIIYNIYSLSGGPWAMSHLDPLCCPLPSIPLS